MTIDASQQAMQAREVLVHIDGRIAVVSHWDGERYDEKPYGGVLTGDKIRGGHVHFMRSPWNRLRIASEVYRQLRGLL
jgi:hypothetical protein